MMGDLEGEGGTGCHGGDVGVPVAGFARDGDGDGWTDLLERRLRTDPEKADTDGTAGGRVDPAPRGWGRWEAGRARRGVAGDLAGMFAFSEEEVPLFVTGTADEPAVGRIWGSGDSG